MMRTGSDPLRPETLTEFIGQPDVTRQLNIILTAANNRGELCDHILFSGPPGTGKTTLSNIIANSLDLPLVITSGPALEKPGDLAGLLTKLATPSVVFIDEIHRMNRATEELLYPALEDGVIDIMVGDGIDNQSVRIPIQPFVLVGATTQAGMLAAPLRDRFGYHGRLGLYDLDTLTDIVERSGRLLNLDITREASEEVASRAQGTPRIANRLLRRVRDWAEVREMEEGPATIDKAAADSALDDFGIDKLGLDGVGREILKILCTARDGHPIGLQQLASMIGEDMRTIEEVYEPYLLKLKLIARTQRGRVATKAGYAHMGLALPDGGGEDGTQPTLLDSTA